MPIRKFPISSAAPAAVLEAIAKFAERELVPVTMQDLLASGRHVRHGYVAQTLEAELCARLAHQTQRLCSLPMETAPSKQLIAVHIDTFQSLMSLKPVVQQIHHLSTKNSATSMSSDPLEEFRRGISSVSSRHATNLESLMEAKKAMRLSEADEPAVQQLIDDFLGVHIGFQLLCTHFLQASRQSLAKEGYAGDGIGCVSENCDLKELVDDAVSETQLITEHHLEDAPDVIVEGDTDARACCIPSHIHHVLFETLKNSMRATALNHREVTHMIPPVRVRLSAAPSEVTVLISDQGGGMSLETVNKAFRYLWTSSETYADVEAALSKEHSYQRDSDPLSGMGIGLPVSRLYARHFGGDLRMLSAHGFGTQVALYIPSGFMREKIKVQWQE